MFKESTSKLDIPVRFFFYYSKFLTCMNTIPFFYLYFQGAITNILEENVVQPLLVSISAIQLASETVRSILKIDDIVSWYFYSLIIMFLFCISLNLLLYGLQPCFFIAAASSNHGWQDSALTFLMLMKRKK